jgi:hypothetical protein
MRFDLPTGTYTQPLTPFLSDQELADILRVKVSWVRRRAAEIPGYTRLGSKYRFSRRSVEHWLGSLEPLLFAEDVAALLQTTPKWIYANADSLVGFARLGRYIRFLPTQVRACLDGDSTEVLP